MWLLNWPNDMDQYNVTVDGKRYEGDGNANFISGSDVTLVVKGADDGVDITVNGAGGGAVVAPITNTVAAAGASETLTAAYNLHDVTLDEACTFTFTSSEAKASFTLILRQDATGGFAATWPSSVDWPSATAPTLTTGANDVSVLEFLTVDSGTTWLGFAAGIDLA